MPGSIPVVVNALSGHGHADDDLAKLAGLFRAAGAEAEIHLARTGAEIVDLVKNLSRENPERIIAGGGDGTMSTLASVLAQDLGTLIVLRFIAGIGISGILPISDCLVVQSWTLSIGIIFDCRPHTPVSILMR